MFNKKIKRSNKNTFFLIIFFLTFQQSFLFAQTKILENEKSANQGSEESKAVVSAPKTTAPYSLPWQLRPVMAVNVIRLDSAISFYNDRNEKTGGIAFANIATGSYKILPSVAILTRLGGVRNTPPAGGAQGFSFLNPLIGGIYSAPITDEIRMGLFLGSTIPVGSAGGNYPSLAQQLANSAGILARSAMDNALFSTNYLTLIPGVGIAYIANGFTVQIEATILELVRVRGEQIDKDSDRTNFTTGVLLGYSLIPSLFFESEIRYQRWLNNNTVFASANPAKENLSFAIGPRFNFKVENLSIKPGIAYAFGIAGPIAESGYTFPFNSNKTIFIDIPVLF